MRAKHDLGMLALHELLHSLSTTRFLSKREVDLLQAHITELQGYRNQLHKNDQIFESFLEAYTQCFHKNYK